MARTTKAGEAGEAGGAKKAGRSGAKASPRSGAKAGTGKPKGAPNARATDAPARRKATTSAEPIARDDLDELARLWEEFKREGSAAHASSRERLILHYAPLVKYVASRVATGLPSSVDQADLVSYGMFGLIDALEKFDRNAATSSRRTRSRGSRERSSTSSGYGLGPALRPLQGPGDREGVLGPRVDPEAGAEREGDRGAPRRVALELHEVINQISFVQVLQLDEILSVGSDRGESRSRSWTRSPTAASTRRPGSRVRRPAACSPPRSTRCPNAEKIVVTLYYFEGLTLAEIGEILGVTESRVCQIHTKAVGQLRLQFVETD